MSRTLSWKWLCSRLGLRHTRTRTPTSLRPCLAALDQLEDRVLLSSTPLIPLSNQSVSAVDAFLKFESTFIAGQNTFLQSESTVIQQSNNVLPASIVDYFLKIDDDGVQIDTDLIVTPAAAGAAATTGGIDGILTNLALPVNTAIDLEAQVIPAVAQQLQTTNTLIALLSRTGTPGGVRPDAYDAFLKLDGIEGESLAAATGFTLNFTKIEYQFIGADATDLGPALGVQGSASAGPAGGLLQDVVVLTSDADPTLPPPAATTPPAAVVSFLTIESAFIDGENSFIKSELTFRKASGGELSSAAVDYFLKLDADLVQVDNDLAPASVAGGATAGIDGVLLKLQLPPTTLATINTLVPAVQQAQAAAIAAEKAVQGAGSTTADDKLAGLEATAQQAASQLTLNFAKIEYDFINLDPTDLGPALGLQGSKTPGPAGGLLQDVVALASDAGGQFPGAIIYPPPAVVDAFIKFENAIIQNQSAMVAAEQAFIKLDVQLPAVIVDYFVQIDDDQLEIDTALIGTPGSTTDPGGIDGALESLAGMPAAYDTTIQALKVTVLKGQAALTAAETALEQNAGGTATAAALLYFASFQGDHDKFQEAFGDLVLSFGAIENEFIGLNPGNAAYVQDSKNIADGAAKAQAVE